MNRLLTKTLLYYTVFATLLLVLSAPVFYWTIENLYHKDIDEAIELRKLEFQKNNLPFLSAKDISIWNNYNRDIHIIPDTTREKKEQVLQTFFLDTLENEWEPYRVLYASIRIEQQPYTLMIRQNLVESEDLIQTLTELYLVFLSVLFLVLFILTRIVSKSLWKPFYNTLEKIEGFVLEHHSLPDFTNSSIKEFEQLNQGLTKLIQENIHTYKSQKEFTENASHELQTPLAVFQSKLDLLVQQPNLTEAQVKLIHVLYDSVARLVRVNKNLLLLSKIEHKQYAEKENVDIAAVVKEAIPYFSEQAESKKIKIQAEIFGKPFFINANKGLLEIMINNLLLNAIRHNNEGGSITIAVSNNQLRISNTGTAKSLNTETIFKRFSKSSENAHSSGLGLAIIKQICQLYMWKEKYEFKNSVHNFYITF